MPSLVPLDNILGAAFIGILVSTAIYGITCLQGYIYYTENSSGDKRRLKTFVEISDFSMLRSNFANEVVFTWQFLSLASSTLCMSYLGIFYYRYTVTNFGDYAQLQAISTWSLLAQVVVEDIIALMVQFFFAYRIYQLSRSFLIPVVICILSIGQFGCGIGFTLVAGNVKIKESGRTKTWTITGMGISAACDLFITTSMIYYLWSQKQHAKLSRGMNRTINSLMRYSLNTGFLTTVFAVATAIAFVKYETSFIYGPFFFVLSRMYACSFLAVLNTRQNLREKMNGDVQLYSSGYPSAIAFASGGTQTIGSAVEMEGSQDNLKAPRAF